MKKLAMVILPIILMLVASRPTPLAAQTDPDPGAASLITKAKPGQPTLIRVRCDRGDTIAKGLRRAEGHKRADIVFRGTCQERVVIRRDDVILRGEDATAEVVGLVDVFGGDRVTLRNFLVRDGDGSPRDPSQGGVNIQEGAAVTIEDMRIENIPNARGLLMIASTGSLKNVAIRNAAGGGFVFRASNITLDGDLTATDCPPFGMSLVNTGAFARTAKMTFSGSAFGLVVQIRSGLEHVDGFVVARDNQIGILVAGKGMYAFGVPITLTNNSNYGLWVNELSDMTHLIRNPPLTEAITATGNGTAIYVEDSSFLDVVNPSMLTGNDIGLLADNGQLQVTGLTSTGNATADVRLTFDTKATFLGTINNFGTPVQCDGTAMARGGVSCGAPVSGLAGGAPGLQGKALLREDPAIREALALSRQ
jgi:hypothetical protein